MIQQTTRFTVILLALLSACFSLKGQDVHFSQFYSSPLTLNPAMTGLIQGDIRAVANHRNPWAKISKPYTTSAASVDGALQVGGNEADRLGLGGRFVMDQAGGGELNTMDVSIMAAYHKALGNEGNHRIVLGAEGGILQKSLASDELVFPNQVTSTGINSNLPSDENISGEESEIAPDFGAGVMYYYRSEDDFIFHSGLGVHHLFEPTYQFLGSEGSVGKRWVANMGVNYKVSKLLRLKPAVLYMNQSKASEITFGSNFEFTLSDYKVTTTAFAGTWYRVGDAMIGAAGLQFDNFRVSVSYDLVTSGLSDVSNGRGGPEFSLIYVADIKNKGKKRRRLYCPVF
jgi:type IX secretion system PorP/SprF family membrane protein